MPTGKHWRRRCPTCQKVKAMRKGQKTCSFACAGPYRAAREDKARRAAVMKRAGKASAKVRRAKAMAKIEAGLGGGCTRAEAWRMGYEAGYSAGYYRGAYYRREMAS